MKTLFGIAAVVIGAILIVTIIALAGGTILYWIWPVAIPAAFPALVENSSLASELTWWQAVTLVWVFGILIKSTNTATSNK